jgi:hypothetical protein
LVSKIASNESNPLLIFAAPLALGSSFVENASVLACDLGSASGGWLAANAEGGWSFDVAAVGSGSVGIAAVGSAGIAAVGSDCAGIAPVGSAGIAAVGSDSAGITAVGSGSAGIAAVGSGSADIVNNRALVGSDVDIDVAKLASSLFCLGPVVAPIISENNTTRAMATTRPNCRRLMIFKKKKKKKVL